MNGLISNTLYVYRACTSDGCSLSRTFRTTTGFVISEKKPIIITGNPTNVGANRAVLNGTYVSNAKNGTCWFDYGRTSSLGKQTRSYNVGSGYGTCIHNFTNLASRTQYCIRSMIKTVNGIDYGETKCFNTGRGDSVVSGNTKVIVVEKDNDVDIDFSSLGLGFSLVRLEIGNDQNVLSKGENIEYLVEWENVSELDIFDIKLKINLPKEIEVQDVSKGQYDQSANVLYYTINELKEGIKDQLIVSGRVVRGSIGSLITAEVELAYNNPINDAQENAKDFDIDEYGTRVLGVEGSVFGLTNITFLGWLVILLGLFIIFLVARWLYLQRKELQTQPYTPHIPGSAYDNNRYTEPTSSMPDSKPMREDNNKGDDDYQPYRPNRS